MRGLSAHVPIDFLEYSSGFNFCPAKIFRDDPTFALYMQELMVAWEMGKIPDGSNFSSMDEEIVQDLYDMITIWKRTERESNFFNLGLMLCGDPDNNKNDHGSKK